MARRRGRRRRVETLRPLVKRKTRKLKEKAVESLTLSVEIFNRPSPTARTQGVLLSLQHGFEMLFKAVIWEDRKRISPTSVGKAYSFKECLGIVQGMGLLNENEAITAGTIDAHRDEVQHQGADVSEERLYLDAMSGLRLFDDILQRAFDERLSEDDAFAGRMLPVTANPPRELHLMTESDVKQVRELLQPPKRQRAEAYALLRTLIASEQVAQDPNAEVQTPNERELDRVAESLTEGAEWAAVFPGLARLSLAEDADMVYRIRIVKNAEDAVPVKVVKAGEEGAGDAVSILERDKHARYPFGLKALGEKSGVNQYEAQAVAHLLRFRDSEKTFLKFTVDKVTFQHYSHEALRQMRQAVEDERLPEAKAAYNEFQSQKRRAKVPPIAP